MSNVNLINYSTREFTTKGEMDSYIRKQDEIFTEEVTKIFIEAGMLRRVVTQIWNKEGTFRVGILFEYKDQPPQPSGGRGYGCYRYNIGSYSLQKEDELDF